LSGIQQVDARLKSAGMTVFWFLRAVPEQRSLKYSAPRSQRSSWLNLFIGFVFVTVLIGCDDNDGSTITESGTLEATEVTVSAQASGAVEQLYVDEGASVREGDTLVVLDTTDLSLQLKQAEAGLAMAEAQYKLTLEGMRKEDVLQAEANFKSAETDLQRMKELYEAKSVSQKQLDDAQTRFTIAQQTYEKAIKGSRQEEIIAARARRDQASAQAAALRKKVNDCRIVAPISGTVTKRYIERGELVSPGMAVVKLSNLQEMSVTVYLPEADIPKIQLGSTAQVQVDAFPDRNFDGRVVFISPTAEFTPKNIQTRDERTKLVFGVKLKVVNPDGSLKAGIPADVTFSTGQ
ncbi:MAG: efflux RND transporter periplasmic adaptor subunit, partial [Nitrososphaera sp.]|nr:efflux RND transporter periplasmic adaptor subunit [Nitrososphaera sp.]